MQGKPRALCPGVTKLTIRKCYAENCGLRFILSIGTQKQIQGAEKEEERSADGSIKIQRAKAEFNEEVDRLNRFEICSCF